MVLTVSFVLSPVTGLFATVAPEKLVSRTQRPHRGVRTTRLRRPRSALFVNSASASIASRPTSVTIAKRPSFETDGEE